MPESDTRTGKRQTRNWQPQGPPQGPPHGTPQGPPHGPPHGPPQGPPHGTPQGTHKHSGCERSSPNARRVMREPLYLRVLRNLLELTRPEVQDAAILWLAVGVLLILVPYLIWWAK